MLGALIGCLAFQLDRWCASSDLPTNLSVSCLRYSRTHINNEIRHTTLFLSFRVCAILWCSHHYKRCTALSMHNFSEEMKEKRNRNRIETKRFVCLLDIDFPEVYVWISSNSSDFILLESDEMSEKYQKHIHIIFSLLFIKVSLFGLRISRNWRMWPKHKSKDTHTESMNSKWNRKKDRDSRAHAKANGEKVQMWEACTQAILQRIPEKKKKNTFRQNAVMCRIESMELTD